MKIPFATLKTAGALLLTLGLGSAAGAQVARVNPLDNTNVFARAAILGPAFTGVADDASAVYSNPAGLARLGGGQLLVNSHFWLVQTNQETIALGFPAPGRLGGLALAVNYLDYGTFEGRDDLGTLAPSYQAERWSLKGGWGKELHRGISVGAALASESGHLAGNSTRTFGVDVGLMFRFSDRFRAGLACNQIGTSKSEGDPASTFQTGISGRFPLGSKGRLLAAVGGSLQPDGPGVVQAGLELSAKDTAFIRAGYAVPTRDQGFDGVVGLAVGIGIAVSGVGFDYSFLPYGDVGQSHRVSLGYRFGKKGDVSESAVGVSTGRAGAAGKNLRTADRSDGGNKPAPAGKTRSVAGEVETNKTRSETGTDKKGGVVSGGNLSGAGRDAARLESSKAADGPPTASLASVGPKGILEPKSNAPSSSGKGESLVLQFDLTTDTIAQGADLEKQGQYQDAARVYRDAIRKDTRDASAWWALGNLYRRFGMRKEAVQCYETVLRLEPGSRGLEDWLKRYKGTEP